MSKDLLFHSDTSSDEDYKKEKRKRKRLIHGRRKDSDDDVVVVIEQVETAWSCNRCTYANSVGNQTCELASDDDFSHHDASMSSQPSRPFSQGNDRSHPPSIEVDTALWNDKYRPHGMVDLVIHPKKAQEVSDWLSTLVRSLATKLGMAVKEWQDTTGMSNRQHKAAAMDDFSSFLERSQRYPSLAFSSKASQTSSRHVILVEEWPSFHADHRAELQRVLQRRLDAQGDYAASPIVIVYSDVREGKVTTNMLAKEFSAQVMQSPLVHVIHCNPIAPGTSN
ncbi:hypothetical protein DYB25_006001 [Aphanomyces astaci]|uniref:Uncharacterized protein n=1 Tax=Aphanomyces astaci TaxID=112090 RepID=A0A397B4Z3_APHAT|nr:hypothetical protein DYB25_006001 [Aphanomyces astaci]